MNVDRARALLAAERVRVTELLAASATARIEDNEAMREAGDGDADAAAPLQHEIVGIKIDSILRERLAALDRADARIAKGTYGFSVNSGAPIPDARLVADPAAELTVTESAMRGRHR
jgi:DnaK suppressor protein